MSTKNLSCFEKQTFCSCLILTSFTATSTTTSPPPEEVEVRKRRKKMERKVSFHKCPIFYNTSENCKKMIFFFWMENGKASFISLISHFLQYIGKLQKMGEISCNFPIRMKNGKACFIFINFPNYCDICGWCTNQMKTYQMTTTAKHVLFHKSRSSLVIFCQSDVYISLHSWLAMENSSVKFQEGGEERKGRGNRNVEQNCKGETFRSLFSENKTFFVRTYPIATGWNKR